jgi:hypothetical protein
MIFFWWIGQITRIAGFLTGFPPIIFRDIAGDIMKEIDDENYERLSRHKWHVHKSRKTFYARRCSSAINGKCHIILMHHEIIGWPLQGFVGDHEDGNGLNNQRHNLRHVTLRQNAQNRKNIVKSSKYPGVTWNKSRKKWMAKITIKGINQYLGRFMNELEAFNAYKQAVKAIGETII